MPVLSVAGLGPEGTRANSVSGIFTFNQKPNMRRSLSYPKCINMEVIVKHDPIFAIRNFVQSFVLFVVVSSFFLCFAIFLVRVSSCLD